MELVFLVCEPESVVVLKVRHLSLRSVTVLLSFRNVTHTNRTWEKEEGTQNLKWIGPISSDLWFPQFRQFRQFTWNLTVDCRQLPTGLTKQLMDTVMYTVRGVWGLGIRMLTLDTKTSLYTEDLGLQVPMTLEYDKTSLKSWPESQTEDLDRHVSSYPSGPHWIFSSGYQNASIQNSTTQSV